MTKGNADLALVLSGGGARAAYQVGFLRVLAREFPDVVPGILTGVSAGGINAAYLAARPDPFDRKVEALADIWRALRIDSVFRVDLRDLASRSVRWGGRLLSGGKYVVPPARSLVDTEPLHELLQQLLQSERGDSKGIARNLDDGWLHGPVRRRLEREWQRNVVCSGWLGKLDRRDHARNALRNGSAKWCAECRRLLDAPFSGHREREIECTGQCRVRE